MKRLFLAFFLRHAGRPRVTAVNLTRRELCGKNPEQLTTLKKTNKKQEMTTLFFQKNIHLNTHLVSPWHDVPYKVEGMEHVYEALIEIPKCKDCTWHSDAKMEVSTKMKHNPIDWDIEKPGDIFEGHPRYYKPPMWWNYGMIPQTWEDPAHKVQGYKGDGDPVDIVEICCEGDAAIGSWMQVGVIGALGMIDGGEIDYKVVVCDTKSKKWQENKEAGIAPFKDDIRNIRDWFRDYKRWIHIEVEAPKDGAKPTEETLKAGAERTLSELQTSAHKVSFWDEGDPSEANKFLKCEYPDDENNCLENDLEDKLSSKGDKLSSKGDKLTQDKGDKLTQDKIYDRAGAVKIIETTHGQWFNMLEAEKGRAIPQPADDKTTWHSGTGIWGQTFC